VKKLGTRHELVLEIEEAKDKDAIAKAVPFLTPDICLWKGPNNDQTPCYGDRILWETNPANTDEGQFMYIKRRCLKCRATSTMGEYKMGGYFWKNWEVYVKDGQAPAPTQAIPKTKEEEDAMAAAPPPVDTSDGKEMNDPLAGVPF